MKNYFRTIQDVKNVLTFERWCSVASLVSACSWLHREVHILVERAGRLTDENMWQFWFVVNVGYFWLTFWQFAVIIAAKFGQFGAIWSNFGQFWAISCNPISCNLGQFKAISINFSNFWVQACNFLIFFKFSWRNSKQFEAIFCNFG